MQELVAHAVLAAATADTPQQAAAGTLWDVAQQVVAFIIALGALYVTVLRPLARTVARRVEAAIAAIALEQAATKAEVGEVKKQVHPNGGKSAHDYARKAAEGVSELQHQVFILSQDTQENRRRTDSVATELVTQGQRLAELTQAVAPINARLDALAAEQRADRMWQRQTDQRLTGVEQQLTEVRAAQ